MADPMSDQNTNQKNSRLFGSEAAEGSSNMEILFLLAFIAAWFILQMWVLPRFGVST
jgi:hypothetical protein